AARSRERPLGLVLAHEMGKKAFFDRYLPIRGLDRLIAELIGNLYELFYFLKQPRQFIGPNLTRFINAVVAIAAIAIGFNDLFQFQNAVRLLVPLLSSLPFLLVVPLMLYHFLQW